LHFENSRRRIAPWYKMHCASWVYLVNIGTYQQNTVICRLRTGRRSSRGNSVGAGLESGVRRNNPKRTRNALTAEAEQRQPAVAQPLAVGVLAADADDDVRLSEFTIIIKAGTVYSGRVGFSI
jgi:hypothetical protein